MCGYWVVNLVTIAVFAHMRIVYILLFYDYVVRIVGLNNVLIIEPRIGVSNSISSWATSALGLPSKGWF